jgi:glycopeptide antibiotics resistance protein
VFNVNQWGPRLRRFGFALSVALILLATLPWGDFLTHPHFWRIAWVPFATGIVRLGDLIANAALYMPWGLLFPGRAGTRRLVVATISAAVLSTIIEASQIWSHTRFPSATDVTMNALGAALGAWLSLRPSGLEPPLV